MIICKSYQDLSIAIASQVPIAVQFGANNGPQVTVTASRMLHEGGYTYNARSDSWVHRSAQKKKQPESFYEPTEESKLLERLREITETEYGLLDFDKMEEDIHDLANALLHVLAQVKRVESSQKVKVIGVDWDEESYKSKDPKRVSGLNDGTHAFSDDRCIFCHLTKLEVMHVARTSSMGQFPCPENR